MQLALQVVLPLQLSDTRTRRLYTTWRRGLKLAGCATGPQETWSCTPASHHTPQQTPKQGQGHVHVWSACRCASQPTRHSAVQAPHPIQHHRADFLTRPGGKGSPSWVCVCGVVGAFGWRGLLAGAALWRWGPHSLGVDQPPAHAAAGSAARPLCA